MVLVCITPLDLGRITSAVINFLTLSTLEKTVCDYCMVCSVMIIVS